MNRLLLLLWLFLTTGLGQPAAAQTDAAGLPPRPAPFRFVNDQAQLLAPADAKKLESGLRRYADNTGTQLVVVTVPSLGGREVADYGRALGTAWGVGQRDKNNGLVVLISQQERKVTIQPGSGLAATITPAVTRRVIGQMAPGFKQGNYFVGLRAGLNTLMATANPGSAQEEAPAGSAAGASATASAGANGVDASNAAVPAIGAEPVAQTPAPAPEPASSGLGIGTLLIGALLVGGVLWFLIRMFRGRSSAANPAPGAPNATPNFLPNRPTGPAGGPGFGQGQGSYGGAPNQGGMMGGMGGGMGMGGILATGAAVAAGAYLGNRLADGNDPSSGNNLAGDGSASNLDAGTAAGAGAAGAAGTGAAGDYFSSRDGGAAPAPDYFSADESAADNTSGDYFSADDNSSYDDTSSADSGGGGFDGDSGDSGSF
ncbi:TPM domain-containing protein [Hymenobacter sp.]|uniref:TPM domain-containing protein n=1 Tax=Hymenobacter sp. TaxID=1898978 RepID=UPI00286C2B7F|nr:TPM domain-containing protein [Hymenobacter sp.]